MWQYDANSAACLAHTDHYLLRNPYVIRNLKSLTLTLTIQAAVAEAVETARTNGEGVTLRMRSRHSIDADNVKGPRSLKSSHLPTA